MTQLMQKSNRLEFFADSGLKAASRAVRSGKCGDGGHYHLTCSKNAKCANSHPIVDIWVSAVSMPL